MARHLKYPQTTQSNRPNSMWDNIKSQGDSSYQGWMEFDRRNVYGERMVAQELVARAEAREAMEATLMRMVSEARS